MMQRRQSRLIVGQAIALTRSRRAASLPGLGEGAAISRLRLWTRFAGIISADGIRLSSVLLSWGLIPDKKTGQFVLIGIGGIAFDSKHLGDITPAMMALDVNEKLDGIGDMALDGPVGQFNAALQDATGETLQGLRSGVGVNGRDGTRMAGVQGL